MWRVFAGAPAFFCSLRVNESATLIGPSAALHVMPCKHLEQAAHEGHACASRNKEIKFIRHPLALQGALEHRVCCDNCYARVLLRVRRACINKNGTSNTKQANDRGGCYSRSAASNPSAFIFRPTAGAGTPILSI